MNRRPDRRGVATTRIAVVTETFLPFRGGSAKRYYEVFRRFPRFGFEVDLYTARLREDWACDEEIDGIHVVRSPKVYDNLITEDGFRDISQVLDFSLWAAKKLINDDDCFLVEANHCPIFPAMASWFRSRLKNALLTMTFHEAWHREWYLHSPSRIYPPVGIVLEKMLTWLPDVGIAVSHFTADRLVKLFRMNESRIETIPNGVDLDLIRKVRAKREERKIVYVGRLNPHKKVAWLIDAFGMLKQDYPEAELEIVGDGPMRDKYVRHVSRNGLRDVSFRSNVQDEEIISHLKSSRLYVLPSIREGQSITTLEAMASGTPQIVVEAEGNGAADLVAESRSGVCVKPCTREIYKAMKRLLEDEDAWRRLSENGVEYTSNLTWDNISQLHKNLYASLCVESG